MKWKKTFLRYEILFLPIWKSGCHIIWRLQIVLVHYSIRWWDWHIIHLMVHLVSCFLFPLPSPHPLRDYFCCKFSDVWNFSQFGILDCLPKFIQEFTHYNAMFWSFIYFFELLIHHYLVEPFWSSLSLSCTSFFFFFLTSMFGLFFPLPYAMRAFFYMQWIIPKACHLGEEKH